MDGCIIVETSSPQHTFHDKYYNMLPSLEIALWPLRLTFYTLVYNEGGGGITTYNLLQRLKKFTPPCM